MTDVSHPDTPSEADFQKAQQVVEGLSAHIRRIFVGQESVVEAVLVGICAGGHILLESNPGLGKTLLVRGLSHILGLQSGRIQFTPDLMPADITGSHIYNLGERRFEFRPGPIFTQFLLADEVNRSPAKTHAALLEAMQERQVTLDGTRYPLEPPFIVVATQNPVESEGTYQLPEATLDRFLLKLVMDYPSAEDEERIVSMHLAGQHPLAMLNDEHLSPICDREMLLRLQHTCQFVRVDPSLVSYICGVVRSTRRHAAVFLGASPRAAVALVSAARALALLRGRDFAIPDDVVDMAPAVLRHRILLTPESEIEQRSCDDIISEALRDTPVPRT